ncbi:hypothetical protein ACFL6U_20280 [Planctomycetota bacterium]
MPIVSPDSTSSGTSSKKSADEPTRSSSSNANPATSFFERIESWLQDAGPREKLFAVALDIMLTRKEAIKKATNRDIYKDTIEQYRDTVCLVAGGSETLPDNDEEDDAMAAAIAALIALG